MRPPATLHIEGAQFAGATTSREDFKVGRLPLHSKLLARALSDAHFCPLSRNGTASNDVKRTKWQIIILAMRPKRGISSVNTSRRYIFFPWFRVSCC